MLEIVNYNEGEYEFPCLLVLGCFDGLHIGHAELLKKAKLQAKINGLDLGVMMFADGKGGKQVYSFEERVALLEQYNVKFVLKIDFTNDFKNTKPLDFLQIIEDKLNVKAYMSGKDFRFGAGAKGKSSTLKNYGEDEENGVWYMSVKDVLSGSDKVSTTYIKTLLENGDISRANELLGRNFFVCGTVTETCGAVIKVLYPQDIVKIKNGGYIVRCTVGGNEYNGTATVNDVLQINLEEFGGNIDGQQVKIEFLAVGGVTEENLNSQPEELTAVEELAVAEDAENNSEVSEVAETVETVETVEAVETVENFETEQQLPEENFAEDNEFEDELDEEFETPAEENAELTEAVEDIKEEAEAVEETVEVCGEAEEPAETDTDESYTLTETAEENEADEGQTLTEIAEEPVEEVPEEEISEEAFEEVPEEEISEEVNESIEAETQVETAEEPVEEDISEEESIEVTTEEVSDDGENSD